MIGSLARGARRDHEYRFDGATRVPVRLGRDHLDVGPEIGDADTLILPLTLRASLLGGWLPPEITALDGSRRILAQAFDQGANGRRYLDLSPALPVLRRGGTLRLAGAHVAWEPEDTFALAFRGGDAASPVLVIAPHPDDAEIAAFGLYRTTTSHVVTLTLGDGGSYRRYGHLVADPRRHAALKARLRFWDSVAVPALGGVPAERALNLCYPDTHLQAMRRDPDREVPGESGDDMNVLRSANPAPIAADLGPARPTWGHLVRDLAALLTRLRPRTIVAPHPLLDRDDDHGMAALAVFEAVAASGAEGFALWLYTNHATFAEHFPFGAPAGLMGIPPWFDGAAPFHGVVSRGLDEETRLLKLFALDAMHDLRRGPPGPEAGFGGDLRLAAAALKNGLARRSGLSLDYFRRAARPNELFFTYRPEDVPRIREAFLRRG